MLMDGRTDMTKLIVAFRIFFKTPEKPQISSTSPVKTDRIKTKMDSLKINFKINKYIALER
jgi:hypothetical protein